MRPTKVALRTFVLLLVTAVAGATLLAAFHHHPSVCQAAPESGRTEGSFAGDCVVCRLAEPKASAPETPQDAPTPDAVPDEVFAVAGKIRSTRTVPIRAPRAPPATLSSAV